MKRWKATLVTVVLTSSLIVMPVFAEPSVDDLKANKKAAEEQVSSLQSQLTDLLNKLGQLEEDLIAKGEEITKAEEDLKEAEALEKQQYEDMKLRIQFMYEEGNTSAVEAIVTSENFGDLVNKAEYVQNVHDYDRDKLQEYVDTKKKIADLKTTLEEEKTNLEGMQSEYESKEDELNTTIETKKSEIADFDTQIQAAAEAAAAEAARQQEAERQAAAADNNGGGGSGTGGGSGSGNGGGGGSSSGIDYTGTGNTATAQAIVSAAYSQLGVPYVWGGTTPGVGLDCSGLTQYCHRVAGISIGRTSQVQGGGGKAVSSPQPGDLVCYGTHIGIYIGNGQMIHAPHTGDVVRVANVYGSPWYRRYW